MVDTAHIGFVKRIAVTPHNAQGTVTASDIDQAMARLNRCFSEFPKGEIIAIEFTPCLLEDAHGTHYFRFVSYHVGFPREPQWLIDESR